MSKVRVLVGTKKGAFVCTSDGNRKNWQIEGTCPYSRRFIRESARTPDRRQAEEILAALSARSRDDGLHGGASGAAFFAEAVIEYVSKCRCWGVGVSLYQERRIGFGGGFMIRFLGLGDDETELYDGGFGTGLSF